MTNNETSKRASRDAYARELLRELTTVERLSEKYGKGPLKRRLENKKQAVLANLITVLQ